MPVPKDDDDVLCQRPVPTDAQIAATEAANMLAGMIKKNPTWDDFLAVQQIVSEMNDTVNAACTSLAAVQNAFAAMPAAFNGAYASLSGLPVLFDGNYSSLQGAPAIPSTTRTVSTDTIALTGSGATGAIVHATKDSTVRYNVSTSTTSSIGGPSTSAVDLKICATNDPTEANWTTVATLENDQTITLAIVLNSIQVFKGQLIADVPAGWFRKLVASGSGTHAEVFVRGQKTIYG